MVVAPSWITGQRLQMASFTVPLYTSRTVLVIPEPGVDTSLEAQVTKVLEPFTYGTWALILAIILLVAFLSVCFSDINRIQTSASGQRHIRAHRQKPSTIRRIRVYGRLALDAVLEKGNFFCSGGVEVESGASLSYKILMFGFGFFILVVVSSYVANLAAFLTRTLPDYVGTMEQVIAKNLKVCALPALKSELEVAYPSANFVFSTAGKSYYGLIDDWDAGLCDFIAMGESDASANIELMDMFCDRELFFAPNIIIENLVAFPIRSNLASSLSYWIYEAEKYHGITVESMRQEYDEDNNRFPRCKVSFSAEDTDYDDYAQIHPENFFFPVVFFLAGAVIAIIVQLYHQRTLKRGKKSSFGRPSILMRSAKSQRQLDSSASVSLPKTKLTRFVFGSEDREDDEKYAKTKTESADFEETLDHDMDKTICQGSANMDGSLVDEFHDNSALTITEQARDPQANGDRRVVWTDSPEPTSLNTKEDFHNDDYDDDDDLDEILGKLQSLIKIKRRRRSDD